MSSQYGRLPASTRNTRWVWEQVDAGRSSSSGDLAKIFKNEGIGQPGVLSEAAPSSRATLLAREVIQNSWDAARELKAAFYASGDPIPDFHLEFVFRKAVGAEKTRLAAELGLLELAERSSQCERHSLGLSGSDCLTDLASPKPLQLLEIRERGTTGMYGPFSGARSKLYLALVSLGFTEKQNGAGGSFGYGKAGLVRGSAIHSVVAYTCFRERADDPRVTRRLLGMTYWGLHSVRHRQFSGYARLGKKVRADFVVPFENVAADRVAASLGLATRSAQEVSQLGTTFLLVDPTIRPEELIVAIERNWWPALQDRSFTVSVTTTSGKKLYPKPRQDPVLQPFIEAYELAIGLAEPTSTEQSVDRFRTLTLGNRRKYQPGTLSMIADRSGWSYPIGPSATDDDAATSDRSLVALIRVPRMVVDYLDLGSSVPLIRGVFVADDSVDDLLRMTEPKAHNAWQTVGGDGIDVDAPLVAKRIMQRIRENCRRFRNTLRPPLPQRGMIRLPLLSDLLTGLFTGGMSNIENSGGKYRSEVAIQLDQEVEAHPDDVELIRVVGRAQIALSDWVAEDQKTVRVRIRYFFDEGESAGDECGLTVGLARGFIEQGDVQNEFVGHVTHDPVEFRFESVGYSADWSGRLVVAAEPISVANRQLTAVSS